MRGVADKLFLPLERRLGALGIAPRGVVQPAELRNGGFDCQRRVLRPHGIAVQPSQQGIKGPHRPVEHDDRNQQDHQQQEQVKANHPVKNRLP